MQLNAEIDASCPFVIDTEQCDVAAGEDLEGLYVSKDGTSKMQRVSGGDQIMHGSLIDQSSATRKTKSLIKKSEKYF